MPDAAVFLTDRVEHWAEATPDEPALTYGERTWSWAQLADRVGRVSAGLRAAGIPTVTESPSWTRTIRPVSR